MKPKAPDGPELNVKASEDPRGAFVDWLTHPSNPFFARAAVNRVWASFFGRGFVDPVDDFRVSNPASNEPLLEALARDPAEGQRLQDVVARTGLKPVTALTLLQVLQGLPAPVMVRVPWNEPGIVMKCLDAGFSGLICPMINTAEDAARGVAACRYPPVGNRSSPVAVVLVVIGSPVRPVTCEVRDWSHPRVTSATS